MLKKTKSSKKTDKFESDIAKIIVAVAVLGILGYLGADEATKQTIKYYVTAIVGLTIILTITGTLYYLNHKHKKERAEKIQKIIERKKKDIQQQQQQQQQQNETQNRPIRMPQNETIITQRTETVTRKQTETQTPNSVTREQSETITKHYTEILRRQDPENWNIQNSPGDKYKPQNTSKYEPQLKYEPETKSETKILTNAENHFMEYLAKVIPQNLKINYKTRLADIISNDILDNSVYKWRIINMHLDFILIDNKNKIVLAIELDDESHYTTENRERDKIKNKILEKAKIPLLRIPVAKYYNLIELKNSIDTKIRSRLYS
jgi:hypothetical protein